MNLQKDLVSQELLIDKRLTSGEHKKVVHQNSSGSSIPSTETGAKDEQLLVFPKEQTPRSECVPRKKLADWKDWKEDRKDSSKENAYLSEDTIKLEPLLATDVDIILDEDQEPATCEPTIVYLCAKGRPSRTDIWEEAKAFRNHSRGSYNLNLKTVVDDKLPVAKVVPMPPSPPDPPNPNI